MSVGKRKLRSKAGIEYGHCFNLYNTKKNTVKDKGIIQRSFAVYHKTIMKISPKKSNGCNPFPIFTKNIR